MTLEMTVGKSHFQYKVNEFNNRQIMRRKNKAHARWKHFQYALTEESARAMLLSLQNDTEDDE